MFKILFHYTTKKKYNIFLFSINTFKKIMNNFCNLQVQLPERVVIYEQGDLEGMLYRVKEKLVQRNECSLLVTTSEALLMCQVGQLFYIIAIGKKIDLCCLLYVCVWIL